MSKKRFLNILQHKCYLDSLDMQEIIEAQELRTNCNNWSNLHVSDKSKKVYLIGNSIQHLLHWHFRRRNQTIHSWIIMKTSFRFGSNVPSKRQNNLLVQKFVWPSMNKDIKEWARICLDQQSKIHRDNRISPTKYQYQYQISSTYRYRQSSTSIQRFQVFINND